MLRTLVLKNFVLIDHISLDFERGFHALTGETGAGKTLLVQAIHLLTGQKVSSDVIRSGEEKALIEATFDIETLTAVHTLLTTAGIDYDPQEYLIIKREVARSSKNRIFINSQLAPLTLLNQLGPLLLSLISQNSSHSLKQRDAQRLLLDTFGDLHNTMHTFTQSYQQEHLLRNQLAALQHEAASHRLEKLQWELEEWEAFDYQDGEEESLFNDYKFLSSSQDTSSKLQSIRDILDHPELLSSLSHCRKIAQQLENATVVQQLEQAIVNIQEASFSVSKTLDSTELQPERYQELEERLTKLNILKKKYHIQDGAISDHVKELKEKVDQLSHIETHLSDLKKQLTNQHHHTLELSIQLTELRKKAASRLATRLTEEIQVFNLPHANVHINIDPVDIGPHGADQVTIFLAVNQGEAPSALHSKVSGGELSRFLLGATLILAEKRALPTLIFDEIDSNIGGETATVIGQKLQALGTHCQVIAITHFAQVARFATHHLKISKSERNHRTLTTIEPLDAEGVQAELLRMVGGKEVVASATAHSQM